MKRFGGILGLLTMMATVTAFGQAAVTPDLGVISTKIAARDKAAGGVWYARFEVIQEAPAHVFSIPNAEYGQIYRHRSIEEWWTDGRQCAVAVAMESDSYLDEVLVEQIAATSEPRFVFVNDGLTTTQIDFTVPGRKLILNSTWPFENAAIPVLFGRAFASRPYTEVVADKASTALRGAHHGLACSVVSWTQGHKRVDTWLADELDFLCVREVAYINEILVADRAFDFKSTPAGFRYPSGAVERYVTNDGSESIKTWRTLEFRQSPKLPFYAFSPSERDAALVVDQATGAVLKAPDTEE